MHGKEAWIVTALAFIAAAGPTFASDSWLISDRDSLEAGEPLWLSFVTGQVFPWGDAATDSTWVARFTDRAGTEEREISGFAVVDRGLSLREPVSDPGIHVIGCELVPRVVDIDGPGFLGYLLTERAEKVLSVFEPPADDGRTVRERYTKFAKTIVAVRPVDDLDEGFAIPLGHRLEITPLSNPTRWRTGTTVQVEVLLDGHPWPNIPVSAGHDMLHQPGYVALTQTDADGIAEIELTREGHWFVKAHLIRQPPELGRTQWESFWATLSFRVADDREDPPESLTDASGPVPPIATDVS
ncbi:MAG: DUF4198 domain-containing protein [Planctomycetota bacterium]